jgi:phi13 family phage major tail protein
MALQKNKVKFGLNKVHWAKITAWSDDGVPTFATPVRLPGAVSLSIDANGENENFYADNSVYYVINNNAGYDGDLEVALITTDFATAILGEQLDSKGVLVERNDAETSQFALMFEFDGDKNHIRHVLYCCSASRPANEGETNEESKKVKTEKLKLKASALPSGLVKSKTCENTDETTYNNWYNSVYIPTMPATNNSTGTRSAAVKSAASTTE